MALSVPEVCPNPDESSLIRYDLPLMFSLKIETTLWQGQDAGKPSIAGVAGHCRPQLLPRPWPRRRRRLTSLVWTMPALLLPRGPECRTSVRTTGTTSGVGCCAPSEKRVVLALRTSARRRSSSCGPGSRLFRLRSSSKRAVSWVGKFRRVDAFFIVKSSRWTSSFSACCGSRLTSGASTT